MRQTLFALALLCFFSCQKTEPIVEEVKEVEVPVVENSNEELRNEAIIRNTLSKDFFSLLLSQSLSHPEIFGLAPNPDQVDTRTCPTVTSSGSTFPITLVLDFGPSPGCTPPLFTLPKVGQITITCNNQLFSSGPDTDFVIILSTDYEENGHSITSGNTGEPVEFKFKYVPAETSYKIAFEHDVILTNLTNGNIILVDAKPDFSDPFGTIGFIPDSGSIEDDPADPLTYIDNIYFMSVNNTHITCTNGSTNQDFCLDVTSPSGNGLEFQPWVCHCITTGELRINEDSDCTTGNSNSNADIIYDFGDGTCDGFVDITINGTTTTVDCLPCD